MRAESPGGSSCLYKGSEKGKDEATGEGAMEKEASQDAEPAARSSRTS